MYPAVWKGLTAEQVYLLLGFGVKAALARRLIEQPWYMRAGMYILTSQGKALERKRLAEKAK